MNMRMLALAGANVTAVAPPPPAPAQRAYGIAGYGSTSAATTTSSAVLNFGANAVPAFVVAGLKVVDASNLNNNIGTVASFNNSAGTVTLAANAAFAVANGDSLVFYDAYIDVPGDETGDAAAIASQGFVKIGSSGPTSARPLNPKTGAWHCDTTLGYAVAFDGSSWRNPITGVAV